MVSARDNRPVNEHFKLPPNETFYFAASCKVMRSLLYIIVVILVISWLLGDFAFHVGGDAIHIIIVIAVILLLLNLINGGSRVDRGRWW